MVRFPIFHHPIPPLPILRSSTHQACATLPCSSFQGHEFRSALALSPPQAPKDLHMSRTLSTVDAWDFVRPCVYRLSSPFTHVSLFRLFAFPLLLLLKFSTPNPMSLRSSSFFYPDPMTHPPIILLRPGDVASSFKLKHSAWLSQSRIPPTICHLWFGLNGLGRSCARW